MPKRIEMSTEELALVKDGISRKLCQRELYDAYSTHHRREHPMRAMLGLRAFQERLKEENLSTNYAVADGALDDKMQAVLKNASPDDGVSMIYGTLHRCNSCDVLADLTWGLKLCFAA